MLLQKLQHLLTTKANFEHCTPIESHMVGVWEQQILFLSSLLKTHGTSLNDEALTTLMTEVEAVLYS